MDFFRKFFFVLYRKENKHNLLQEKIPFYHLKFDSKLITLPVPSQNEKNCFQNLFLEISK